MCVQMILGFQKELQDPSTTAERRRRLQKKVQDCEKDGIKSFKSKISICDANIKKHQAAMAALQGEPFVLPTDTIEAVWWRQVVPGLYLGCRKLV